VLYIAASIGIFAQGTVSFSNIGGGGNAPISDAFGTPLDSEYRAQLLLADGTKVGDTASFLSEGLFSGA
jgi:hypothetical protein